MSTSNVIVLTRIKSSRRDLRLLGYDKISRNKYQLWDISRASSQITHEWEFENLAQKSTRIKRINSIKDLERELKKVKKSENHFVVDKDKLWKNKKEVREIENKVSRFGSLSEKYGKIHPIRNKNRDTKSLLKFYAKYLRRVLGNETKRRERAKSKYIFIPTSWCIEKVDRAGISTKIKKIHTEEYDNYLVSDKNARNAKRGGAVFIDQSIPYHVDLKEKYGKKWIEEDEYYGEVEKFLRKLESNKGMRKNEISISAHPHTRVERLKKFFVGRTVRKHETPEMVKKSNIVVTHFSTAALFAVMAKKDICFFSVNSLEKTDETRHIEDMAQMFGRRVNNNKKDEEIDYGKDKNKYDKIMNKLIKSKGTPNINSWVYVYNTLTQH